MQLQVARTGARLDIVSQAIDPRVDIGHVHLKVADLDRSLAFWRDVLGFEEQARGVHLCRRLPPPHRPEHVGVPRRLAASSRHDRPLPRRRPLHGSQDPRGSGTPSARRRHPARGSIGPRGQRGHLPARSRWLDQNVDLPYTRLDTAAYPGRHLAISTGRAYWRL